MSAVLLDQEIVHYEVLGRGRPVILLHGMVGSWRYWVPAMQAASIAYRAYALDFWGFGDSARVVQRYGVNGQVQLLDRFLESMGIGRVVLIGHGLGAVTALQFAAAHPEMVDRVLAVAMPLSSATLHPRLRTAPPAELADWLLNRLPQADPVRMDAVKADPQALTAAMQLMPAENFSSQWAPYNRACLLVHGQLDAAVIAPTLDQVIDLPEAVHSVTFEESGHFPMLDEPSKFNRLMIDFLTLPSGESPRQLQLKDEWKRRVR